MRLKGKITRWDDEKGFGFISRPGDADSIFVHIKAFTPKSRRPEVGNIVSYEVAEDIHGRTRAVNARFANQSYRKPEPDRRKFRAGAIIFTVLFLGALLAATYLNRISWLVAVTYFSMSFLTFIAYGWDKSSARMGAWRTKETTLHLMGLACGWPGGLAGQRVFHHKSSKDEFLSVFWLTVILNVAAAAYLVWSGDTGLLNQLIAEVWRNLTQ